MSDIVERLRGNGQRAYFGDGAIMYDAAAEIERLREALENVLPLAESYLNIMPDRHGHNVAKLEAARAALEAAKKDKQ